MNRREDRPDAARLALGILGVVLMIASIGWVGVQSVRTAWQGPEVAVEARGP